MLREIHQSLFILIGLLTADLASGQGVFGVVRDVAGPGIKDAVVSANVWGPDGYTQFTETTDALGRFILPDVPGSWTVTVEASSLNAAGYLGVGPAIFSITNTQRNLRFTTRRLDLSRLVSGTVKDEWGFAVVGTTIRASIDENQQTYETNLVTDSDGRFWFGASPALWRVRTANSLFGFSRLFPIADVLVEVADAEAQANLVAPAVTTTISGFATNLAGLEVIAECEAHDHRYVQSAAILGPSEAFTLPVFEGIWTVRVTNSYGWPHYQRLPAPTIVVVANAPVQIHFGAPPAEPQQTLAVRVVLSDGSPTTNASVSAVGDSGYAFGPGRPIPGPGSNDPSITKLPLSDGRWIVQARLNDPDASVGWEVSREVQISEGGISNLTLVIPTAAAGPRIMGVARNSNGQLLADQQVSFRATEEHTNYGAYLFTDSAGEFELPVPNGRWLVSLMDSIPCSASAAVVVSGADEHVELVRCAIPSRPIVPIAVTLVDEAGPSDNDFEVSFYNWNAYFWTNAPVTDSFLVSLREGLWTASLSRNWHIAQNDPYGLFPMLRFQHDESSPSHLSLVARQGAARIEGRLRDWQGRLLTIGYATATANIGGTNYSCSAQVSSGYFSFNVAPGHWQVAASTWRYPSEGLSGPVAPGPAPVPSHVDPAPQLVKATNGVTYCEFVAGNAPSLVPLTVSIVREDGTPLAGAAISISGAASPVWLASPEGGLVESMVAPGTNRISASAGWTVLLWERLLFPSVTLNVSTEESNHVVLVARTATGCVRGTISDADGFPLPIEVAAWTTADGTNYSSGACPGPTQEFCLSVFPGDWHVALPDPAVNDLGFRSAPIRQATVPPSQQSPALEFILEPLVGDFRQVQVTNPRVSLDRGVQFDLQGQTLLKWRIEGSEDLVNWSVLSTVATTNGVARILDPAPAADQTKFYRAIWVR